MLCIWCSGRTRRLPLKVGRRRQNEPVPSEVLTITGVPGYTSCPHVLIITRLAPTAPFGTKKPRVCLALRYFFSRFCFFVSLSVLQEFALFLVEKNVVQGEDHVVFYLRPPKTKRSVTNDDSRRQKDRRELTKLR